MVTDNDVARRSGRVTHQTSRRSFSSRLSSPLLSFLPLLSLSSSPPLYSIPFSHPYLSASFSVLFLRVPPPLWTRTAVLEGSIIRGISSILIEIERIDPKNSLERRRRRKKRIPFFARFSSLSPPFILRIVLKIRLKSLFLSPIPNNPIPSDWNNTRSSIVYLRFNIKSKNLSYIGVTFNRTNE